MIKICFISTDLLLAIGHLLEIGQHKHWTGSAGSQRKNIYFSKSVLNWDLKENCRYECGTCLSIIHYGGSIWNYLMELQCMDENDILFEHNDGNFLEWMSYLWSCD